MYGTISTEILFRRIQVFNLTLHYLGIVQNELIKNITYRKQALTPTTTTIEYLIIIIVILSTAKFMISRYCSHSVNVYEKENIFSCQKM